MKAIILSVKFPGNRGGMFRKDLPDLRESTLEAFWDVCPYELILDHHKTHKIITLASEDPATPSTIHYSGLGDRHEVESAKGKTYGWFLIDEPSETALETYLMLLAQLTHILPNGTRPPYMALLGCNPEPGWVEERFDPEYEVAGPPPGRCFVPALPSDNPHLPPGYVHELLLNYPPEWVKKYVKGSWEVSEGMVFTTFDVLVHGIPMPPVGYVRNLKMVSSLDYATTGVSCLLLAGIDPDGNQIILDEYYVKNRLISEHSVAMIELMVKYHKMRMSPTGPYTWSRLIPTKDNLYGMDYILIDPATRAKTLQGKGKLESVIDEYVRNGITACPAHNAVEAGINLIKEHLFVNPVHIHPFIQKRGAPSLFIVVENCPNLIKEMKSWKKEILPSGDAKYIGADHAIDNLKYISLSRPPRPQYTAEDMNSMTPQDQFMTRAHQKWAKGFGKNPSDNTWWSPQEISNAVY